MTEPTQMAPTQQAWALYEPPPIRHRRNWWGVGLVAAAAASVTLGAAVVGLWPTKPNVDPPFRLPVAATHAPSEQPLPPFVPDMAVAAFADPDQRYVSLVTIGGLAVYNTAQAVDYAQRICKVFDAGFATEEVTQYIYTHGTDGLTIQQVEVMVDAAKQAYCPQYITGT